MSCRSRNNFDEKISGSSAIAGSILSAMIRPIASLVIRLDAG